jgi:N-acetylglucosaminyl-diphospho-decaprenol L-rhamnosyltransferase
MSRVSIVVVTHQSAEVIGACLDATAQFSDAEVLVVDNASSDATCEIAGQRNVRILANSANQGFAAAVNQGVRGTTSDLVLLLNPDTRLETALEPLIDCFSCSTMGAAGGMLTGPDGTAQTGFMARNLPTPATLAFEVLGINRLLPRNSLNWHYRCLGNDPMVPAFVDQPAGAFLMFRRSAWQQLGGFDESFWPIWFEDVDFCLRLRRAGYLARFIPACRATHQGGHSVGLIPVEIREKYWYGSLLKYAEKHYNPAAFVMICVAVAVGAAGRAIRAFPRVGWKVFAVYGSVIRLSIGQLQGQRRDV